MVFLLIPILFFGLFLVAGALLVSASRSSKGLKNSARFYLGAFLGLLPLVYIICLLVDGPSLESKVGGDYFDTARKAKVLTLHEDGTFETFGAEGLFPPGTGTWSFEDYDWFEVELKYEGVVKLYRFEAQYLDAGLVLLYDPFGGVDYELIKGSE